MADNKKYIGIYNTLEDVQDALDNGQLSNPYVAKTMDNGKIDYNSLSPVDYSQYWCTYYPIDAKIYVQTGQYYYSRTEYTKGDGKISKADFPDFYCAGSDNSSASTITKFKYFQFDSTSATTSFYYAWRGCEALTEFPMINTSNGTEFDSAWDSCSALTEFPLLNLHNGTNFHSAWRACSKLSSFPMVDTSNGTDFSVAWAYCTSLTSFPMLDLSKGTTFESAWNGCASLTEFPAVNLSSGTNFSWAWGSCTALTSLPQLDLSNGTSFSQTWENCRALTTLGGFGAIKQSFDLSYSAKLTVESLMNVITQAADLNSLGITGKKMTLGSDNLAKLSDEQKAVATSKGWTLA